MKPCCGIEQHIVEVLAGSPAARAGLVCGDVLLGIGGEPVRDVVDYEYLCANAELELRLRSQDGSERLVRLSKAEYEPLGLRFSSGLMSDMRTCRNSCLFCFIDQMPAGVRSSLHVKDDDWRMSFIIGNYVSLTNVDESEFGRMLERRVSPLYISLHTSDPALRVRMMGNPQAGEIMERLTRLKDAGLRFHLQIVLCPGLNDGEALTSTLLDVGTLLPAAQSLSIVPVGLTRYREKLFPLLPNTPEDAQRLIAQLRPMQEKWLESAGTRLAFLSDEWYILAGEALPPYEDYEDFPQLENGVGLLRLFERELRDGLKGKRPLKRTRSVSMAGGESACVFFGWLPELLRPYGIELSILPVHNDYFGGGVNVGGLVVGGDLCGQLKERLHTEVLLIPQAMLRENDDVFLDGMRLSEASRALDVRILPVRDGEHMIDILFRRTL